MNKPTKSTLAESVVFVYGSWSVERYINPYAKKTSLIVTNGYSIDYPILYNDGNVTYDRPERYSQKLRDKIKRAYNRIRNKEL